MADVNTAIVDAIDEAFKNTEDSGVKPDCYLRKKEGLSNFALKLILSRLRNKYGEEQIWKEETIKQRGRGNWYKIDLGPKGHYLTFLYFQTNVEFATRAGFTKTLDKLKGGTKKELIPAIVACHLPPNEPGIIRLWQADPSILMDAFKKLNSKEQKDPLRIVKTKDHSKNWLVIKGGHHLSDIHVNSTYRKIRLSQSDKKSVSAIRKSVRPDPPVHKSIYDYFKTKNFIFSNELLTRYYLSLKTKPFVILTGISGTGKTKIAQIFADYMCQEMDPKEKAKHIAFIAVRPDWTDNRGLLGFHNLLDEKYHATSLLRLLINAGGDPGRPYFVILDEMNLAKVEQYFSDFLSVMESRTSDNAEGEEIDLHSFDSCNTQDGLVVPGKIKIPPNVFFTGTVNIDESTYMFSPKVLDRANVIEFNEVYINDDSPDEGSDFRLLKALQDRFMDDNYRAFSSLEDYDNLKKINRGIAGTIGEIINILQPFNMHFGYRTVNEVSRFLCLASKQVENCDLKEALDIQLLQKILPKFHGTQGKLEVPLKKVQEYCKEKDLRLSFKKLERMLRILNDQGYTSYIE